MKRIAFRTLWLKTHLYLGLCAGLIFVLLGLTGSALVFYRNIDEWLNPELLLTAGGGEWRPLADVIAAAEKDYPASPAVAVTRPRTSRGVWMVWFQGGSKHSPTFTQVLVDPYTGRVTGRRVWGQYLMSFIYKLHFTLHGGKAGTTVVGIAGLLLMVSVCSGLYLWWPLWKSGWRAAFAIRRGRRFIYDVHKTTGIVSALFLVVIAFTGVYMTFPEWVKPVVTVFSEETKPPTNLKATPGAGGHSLTPEQAIAIAQQEFPGAAFDHLHPPHGPDGVYEVALRQPGEVQRSFGRTSVWIDSHAGQVLAVRDPRHDTAADTFIAWQFPLHNGEAFGLAGRWVVFFFGLSPALLFATGVLLWWRKRRARRAQRDRHEQHSCPIANVGSAQHIQSAAAGACKGVDEVSMGQTPAA